MQISGYYRSPTLCQNQIVFVSEDDLWTVEREGGIARRLTSGLGKSEFPALSPDGQWLAFSSSEEGHAEVYLMPAQGGSPERLTYLGNQAYVVGWTASDEIIFASDHQQPFSRRFTLYALELQHRQIREIPTGPARYISYGPNGGSVIARHGLSRGLGELAYWKRYRGGTAGEIWIDRKGSGEFVKLLPKITGNTARPQWIGERIYFISDHEGIGNVYSVDVKANGKGAMIRHTQHWDYYVRGLSTDGQNLIYHAGGDLYVLPVGATEGHKVSIDYRSPRTQLNRKFVSAHHHMEDYELHPKAEKIVIAARGKTFSFDLWKGPVFQHGPEGVMRYRLGRFLNDGNRVVVVSDAGGEESLEIHDAQERTTSRRLSGLELGRSRDMKLSPVADEAILTNHRNELIWVDLNNGQHKILDRSEYSRIYGFNWSPDGRYVAYSVSGTLRTSCIWICDIASGEKWQATRPVLRDVSPVFDPNGDYLYFLSYREFDPVYDNLHFDLGFPRGCRPYLLTLRKNVVSPFSSDFNPKLREKDRDRRRKGALEEDKEEAHEDRGQTSETRERGENSEPTLGSTGERKRDGFVEIDFDGIQDRILAFPVADGRYGQIEANRDRVFFTRLPIEGSLGNKFHSTRPAARAHLDSYDLIEGRTETLINGISSFRLSQDGRHLVYRAGRSLRLVKAGEKPKSESDDTGKKSGWLDLHRVQIPVQPLAEWRQMYREAWRLQRDHFWREDMSNVDWERVYDRYLPLLERLSSRSEFSDLMWEMQGELGTSHAYESGGDYRSQPVYSIGFLGADFVWQEDAKAYRIQHLVRGDLWDEQASSPLARAGVCVEEGDFLLAIDGQPLSRDLRPERLLLHRADEEVSVTIRRQAAEEPTTYSIRTLETEEPARYRDWVESNRRFVHESSGGRVGYVHVPDMGAHGYAEFHRYFLTELDFDGLIVDVRYNGGGHVSQLLLEKLARNRIGYCASRWFGTKPYPVESVAGPLVALTNEYAGSDGDIFSHSFKLLKLGPLIGKRTWGGVIGISPSHPLVDGSVTTQPEYSYWFKDVGWRVENYGTDPDIEVELTPADHVAGRDPQLEAAVQKALELMAAKPGEKPLFDGYPDLSLPQAEV